MGGDDSGEPAAAAELATLASALGESLMAADLPAIVAHKRMADAKLAEAAEEEEEGGGLVPSGAYQYGSGRGWWLWLGEVVVKCAD